MFYGVSDFDYLTTDFLHSLDNKITSIIPTSEEKGKIINNFECFIACPIDTEKASVANINDEVILKLPSGNEVSAKINYIKDEDNDKRVIVFKITDKVEELIEYRKIHLDIIWWSYKGLKVSNGAISEDNDISYIERNKAGYTDKIYVKVLRQNDTYSIIENYTDEELKSLGFDSDFVKNRKEVYIYDELLLH